MSLKKQDLTEKINNMLGLDLDSLTRLTKGDLETLYKTLSQRLGTEESLEVAGDILKRPLREIINTQILGKAVGELTLVELFDALLKRKGGPFGLGILPAILEGRGARGRRKT